MEIAIGTAMGRYVDFHGAALLLPWVGIVRIRASQSPSGFAVAVFSQ